MPENLFQDTFAHYNTSPTQMPTKWTSASGSIVSGVGTGSGYAFRGSANVTLGLNPAFASGFKRFCGGAGQLITFQNKLGVDIEINFLVASDGRIFTTINGLAGPISTFAITFGAVYQFQIKSTFSYVVAADPSYYQGTHTFQVYVNGVLQLSDSYTTDFTHWSGDTTVLKYAEVHVQSEDGAGGWIGDFWVTDSELLGQCPEYMYLPVADGPVINWTPSAGVTHFPNVNTRVPTDATYNSDASVGDIDEYQMATVPAGTVKGLQVTVRLEKDAPGATTIQIVYRNAAGTTVLSTPTYGPSDGSYAFFRDIHRKSVFTGVDWTVAEINGMFVGVKRVA